MATKARVAPVLEVWCGDGKLERKENRYTENGGGRELYKVYRRPAYYNLSYSLHWQKGNRLSLIAWGSETSTEGPRHWWMVI